MATRGTPTEDGHARPAVITWAPDVANRAVISAATDMMDARADLEAVRNGTMLPSSVRRTKVIPVTPKGITRLEPGTERGAIWIVDPDDPSSGDMLCFAYYPTQLGETLEAHIAAEQVPGRSFSVLQHLGGGTAKLSMELFFYDAFITNPVLDRFSTTSGPGAASADGVPTGGWLNEGPRRDLASVARAFFEVYVVGHDGSGAALPFVETYLLWGGQKAPIRVMIRGVQMTMEHFDRGGHPQAIQAKVEMEVYEPTYLVHPFKPRAPKPPGKRKQQRCVAVPKYAQVIGLALEAITQAEPVAAAVMIGLDEEATRMVKTGVPGLGAPTPDGERHVVRGVVY